MDNITNRHIARTHISNFADFAPETCKASMLAVLDRWDILAERDDFDAFVSGVNAVAKRVENKQYIAAAAAIGGSCGSLLIKDGSLSCIKIPPTNTRTTGVKVKPH